MRSPLDFSAHSRGSQCAQLPETRKPNPEIRNPKPETPNPIPETRNPKPETRNPKPEPRNPKPETRNGDLVDGREERADEGCGEGRGLVQDRVFDGLEAAAPPERVDVPANSQCQQHGCGRVTTATRFRVIYNTVAG